MQSDKLSATRYQAGQTLIETIVALFVMTTGLSSGLALATFAFGSSSDISEKITATGLAREGIEITRRMRDSNWLAGSLTSCGSSQFCYDTWLTAPYNFSVPGGAADARIDFDPTSQNGNKWTFALTPGLPPGNYYQLFEQPAGGLGHNAGGGATATNFYRKIRVVYQDTSAPYSAANPLVLVRSSVWWHGKNCPGITDLANPGDTPCKIITEEYLTNWKNY